MTARQDAEHVNVANEKRAMSDRTQVELKECCRLCNRFNCALRFAVNRLHYSAECMRRISDDSRPRMSAYQAYVGYVLHTCVSLYKKKCDLKTL